MDDQNQSRPDDTPPADPGEGVRIIGPDEAAEAIERGDVAHRRADDQLRFGDRPASPPAGPRPSLRFPLDASADPTRVERPSVAPAPDPVTGPVELPHWSDPPTGEVPAVLIGNDGPLIDDPDGEDVDAWSSFATSTPRWRDADDDWDDEGFVERLADHSDEVRIGALGDGDAQPSHDEYFGFDDLEQRVEERTADSAADKAVVDPDDRTNNDWSAAVDDSVGSGDDGWSDDDDWISEFEASRAPSEAEAPPAAEGQAAATGRASSATATATRERGGSGGSGGGRPTASRGGERDMGMAVMVGAGLGVVALALLVAWPTGMVVLIAAALGLAAGEYFGVLRKVGWESAVPIGLATCVLLPFAVYWRGPIAYALIGVLLVAAVLAWYVVGAGGTDPRVLEGSGATILGVAWIGGMGSAAAAMLRIPDDGRWLLLVAILATVAYDVGGLFVGRSMGHKPLSAASPNKTVEGLLGGMAAAFVITLVTVGMLGLGPWSGVGAAFILGIGAALAAPLGDLCQSQLKRDLGVKDMGNLLPGHGGVLDRIDGMLFVIPALYWLAVCFGHVL